MNTEWKTTDRYDPDFAELCRRLNEELVSIVAVSVDPISSRAAETDDFETVILAFADNVPAACAALRPFSKDSAEIKRMYVCPEFRKKGIGTEMLSRLENGARAKGYAFLVLETNVLLPEARSLYESNGYARMESYGPYAFLEDTLCMRKAL